MDQSSWYGPKEITYANFPPYYNNSYQYNKNMIPYNGALEQPLIHNIPNYNMTPMNDMSQYDVESYEGHKEIEKESPELKSLPKKKCKSTHPQKNKGTVRKEKEGPKLKERSLPFLKPSPCRGLYKHSECDRISEEDRNSIHKEFQELTNSQSKWQFIASHVYVHAKSKSTSKGPSRRENTHHYYLTVAGQKVKVCRKFFLATLNISEAVIRTSLEKLSPQGICEDDNRGRKPPPNKLSPNDEEFLRSHVLSFFSSDPNGCPERFPKKFLDSNLSIASMHKMYINLCREQNRKPVSVETYRRICKEYNISFLKPQKEPEKKRANIEQCPKQPAVELNEILQMAYVPNETSYGATNSTPLKQSPQNSFFNPHLSEVDVAREYCERGNSYLPPFDRRPSPVQPQSSYVPDFDIENTQNNTVIEIGAMPKPSDSIYTNETRTPLKMPHANFVKRKSSKLKRLRGESYVDSKGTLRPARPMKPAPCRGQYKHSECDKVLDADRASIYQQFRNLRSSQAQWQFIASHVYVHAKNKSTSKGPSRRENTHYYYLTISGQKVKVCRKFFLATLNVSEAMIRTALDKLSPQGICQDDNRGRKPPPNKLSSGDEEFVKKHILSFRSVDSNYCGKNHAKRYLDSNLSFTLMHKMYVDICNKENRKFVSAETYRRICKECNIAFAKCQRDQQPQKCLSSHQWNSDVDPKEDINPVYKENETSIIHREQILSFSPKPHQPDASSLDFDLHSLLNYLPEGP